MSALSDSTTSSMSPASTLSPTPFSHWEIFPSVMVELSAGMLTVEPPSTSCIIGMRMRVRPLRVAGTRLGFGCATADDASTLARRLLSCGIFWPCTIGCAWKAAAFDESSGVSSGRILALGATSSSEYCTTRALTMSRVSDH